MSGDLYVPGSGGGFVHAGATELDRQLRVGDGIMWTGDPRLELRIGILKEKATGRTARRYEVWRHCEDGSDQRIGTWRMDEYGQILHDLAVMRAGAEGREVSVLDRIDTHNAKIEKANADKYKDAAGVILDHGARLLHDTTQPKQTFRQVGGLRDEKK